MNIDQLVHQFQNADILYLFFKAFAILFSFLYVIYSVVLLKQTQVMNSTLTVERSSVITSLSFVQLIIGLVLVLLAIFTF
jgi:hypothetical protein